MADGSLVRTLRGRSDCAHSIKFSPPNGALLATCSAKSAKLWDVADGRLVRTLHEHSGYVRSVADRRLIRTLHGYSGYDRSVAFSPPNGALLATSCADKTVKLLHVARALAITPFFETLRTALDEEWTGFDTLKNLAPTVGDVTELKLFYSASNAAFKHDEITAAERTKFVTGALELAARTHNQDRDRFVATGLKPVVQKALTDGILDYFAARLIDRLIKDGETLPDGRFTTLAARLSRLDLAVDRFKSRVDRPDLRLEHTLEWIDLAKEPINAVHKYAEQVDSSLHKFRKQILGHKTAASTVSAIVAVFTLGMGSAIGTAARDVFDEIIETIVDFSDAKHVLTAIFRSSENAPAGADLVENFAQDKLKSWMDSPLVDAVKDHLVHDAHEQIAAILKVCVLSDEPDAIAAPSPLALWTPTCALDGPAISLEDPTSKCAELKSLFDLGDDDAELPLDNDFFVVEGISSSP